MSARFRITSGRAEVLAHAPGHDFHCAGDGVEGEVELDGSRIVALDARFPLAGLRATDALGNRELSKFLDLRSRPIATASLEAPVEIGRPGRVRLSIGHRSMIAGATFSGDAPNGAAQLDLTFTGLGYKPPKLLVFKVKDAIRVTIKADIQPFDV